MTGLGTVYIDPAAWWKGTQNSLGSRIVLVVIILYEFKKCFLLSRKQFTRLEHLISLWSGLHDLVNPSIKQTIHTSCNEL